MIAGGYTGRILRANLTTKTFAEETLDERLAREYIGGAGFGIYYLYHEVPAKADPLGPENKLIFASGPLCGTDAPCASRMSVTGKSPLTGAVGMAMTGGHFPAELKFAGYDAMIIEGVADEPTYLLIKNGKVLFRNARHLWGMSSFDCQHFIKNELKDEGLRIACIGPAGENLSRLAAIINERHAAGRKGLGAVMGSKNLKAIAVRGDDPVPIADKEAFTKAKTRMLKAMKESPVLYPAFAKLGTPMVVEASWGLGTLPAKNWTATGEWSPNGRIDVESNDKHRVTNEYCYQCPVGCSQLKMVRGGKHKGAVSVPEFESMYCFGSHTGVESLDPIILADRICDELGIDSISAGVTVGFAMELFERGIITAKDTDGLELKFGNGDAMVEMIRKMAMKEGFGALFADGVRAAAERIGGDAGLYAQHVKGLEMPGYDVRGLKAHGLSLATAYTGADHNRGYAFQEVFGIPEPYPVDRFAIEGKGKLTRWNQDARCVTCDCAPMCAFLMDMAVPGIALENTADLVNGVSGLGLTPREVELAGERVNNLAKAFNTREGFTRADDILPARLMTEPIKEGASKGQYIPQEDLDSMLDEYYEDRGWTKDGRLTKGKLEELNLRVVAEELARAGLI
ncbi:MAG: aldehyde ferredoxin oxidoreductase family protein [Clostridiales bacterium]|nr:aldehyde ferredoxin oxidoreductase family protein [Clostridiales bacterium]